MYSLLYLLFFTLHIAFAEICGFGLAMTGITFVSIIIALTIVPIQEKVYLTATSNGTFPEARL